MLKFITEVYVYGTLFSKNIQGLVHVNTDEKEEHNFLMEPVFI